uniref:Ribosomal RNA-processing protein 7 C-terminal domain-containing protein n=1 Tax=Arion vulgaris TaxID=1028688 RepID=A0A0B6ZVY3_9EUPU
MYHITAEDNMSLLFKGCGEIIRVYLQSKPSSVPLKKSVYSTDESVKSVQVGYVVFRKANALNNALKMGYNQIRYFSDKSAPIISGLRAYCEEYRQLPDVTTLEKEAEVYMTEYYKRKEEEDKKGKEMEGVPDEEGFIKVTRHGKNKGGRRTEETERRGHDHIRNRKKKNELRDFYTFQFRETKKQHIVDLQAKFEEDKKRVREMRMTRKFKPF